VSKKTKTFRESLGKLLDETALATHKTSRMVKKLEWIEMAQLAVSSILFKSLSLKLPYHLQSSFHDSVNAIRKGPK